MDYEGLPVVGLGVEVVGYAFLGVVCEGAKGALAEVKVNYHSLLTLYGECSGQVDGDECLAGAYVERGYHEDLAAWVLAFHEFKVSADNAEGFVDDVAAVGLDNYLAVFRFVAYADGGLEDAFLLVGCGEFSKERRREVFEVFSATYGRVKDFLEVEPGKGYCKAKKDGYEVNHLLVWRYRGVRSRWGGHYAGIVGGEGLGKFVLLSFLEEEEVEVFLYHLLALIAEQAAGLQRDVADARLRRALRLLVRLDLDVQGLDVVVKGTEDGAAQRSELLVQVADQKVFLRGTLNQPVALQHGGVELVDLGLGVGVVKTNVCWEQGTGGSAADVGLEESCY